MTFVKEKKLELIMRQPDFVNATAVADKINEFVMNDEGLIDKVISPALARNGSTHTGQDPGRFYC